MSAKPEHYDVIRRPVITEKATMASEANAVVFEVAKSAHKPQIREAVEALFGVKVKAVNTVTTKGKNKRFRGVKAAFDASGLLNPGKAVPTLSRCAEGGRMHVHHGELRHPELPRY